MEAVQETIERVRRVDVDHYKYGFAVCATAWSKVRSAFAFHRRFCRPTHAECPGGVLKAWLAAAAITEGPLRQRES